MTRSRELRAVRLLADDDPPREVELEGPVAVSELEAVAALERALGSKIKVSQVPRAAIVVGSKLLASVKPQLASVMGGALHTFQDAFPGTDLAFAELGSQPRSVEAYVDEVCGVRADR